MTFLSASRMAMFSHRILSFSARRKQLSWRSCCAFICVRRFWNQNLICLGSSPSSRLSCNLWFSSGCGHSLNIRSRTPRAAESGAGCGGGISSSGAGRRSLP
uniref:Uncharacterized protein n=1 Tax=Arundo donax TaxID=35708 RepID=A0A0A9CJ96_ARUDO